MSACACVSVSCYVCGYVCVSPVASHPDVISVPTPVMSAFGFPGGPWDVRLWRGDDKTTTSGGDADWMLGREL